MEWQELFYRRSSNSISVGTGSYSINGIFAVFQYDRCLLDQDIGKAAVQNAGKWTLTKSGLDEYMKKETMYFDEEKYIAWEGEAARWILEKTILLWRKRAG